MPLVTGLRQQDPEQRRAPGDSALSDLHSSFLGTLVPRSSWGKTKQKAAPTTDSAATPSTSQQRRNPKRRGLHHHFILAHLPPTNTHILHPVLLESATTPPALGDPPACEMQATPWAPPSVPRTAHLLSVRESQPAAATAPAAFSAQTTCAPFLGWACFFLLQHLLIC